MPLTPGDTSTCTAFIENSQLEDPIHLTAGHCFIPTAEGNVNQILSQTFVLQFNVTASNPNCTINHPPVASQFPVKGKTV